MPFVRDDVILTGCEDVPVPDELPDDGELLAAAGWAETPTARVLAKDGGDICVAVVDPNHVPGGMSHQSLEFLVRGSDGRWTSDGDLGPAAGSGWHRGHVYVCGQSSAESVTIEHAGRLHHRTTGVDGWWVFVAAQQDVRPEPRRVG